jgi:hypothetical protein
MNITLTIPDDVAQEIIDGICAASNYQVSSGLTKAQWAKNRIAALIKSQAIYGQQKIQAETQQTAIQASNISLT